MQKNMLSVFPSSQNLSAQERAISVIAGLGLAAAGVKPRPNRFLNVAALLGGVYLALRGATGRCPIKQALLPAPRMQPVAVKARPRRSRVAAR